MSVKCREIQGGLCEITQEYKPGNHEGIDIVNKNYTLGHIVAHTEGTVVGYRSNCNGFEQGSYGNYVKIKHDNGYYTLYAHMAYNTVTVRTGDRVSKGQVLGYMGNTGYSFGGHLHFEVRNKNDAKINPTPYLNADLPGNEPVPTPTKSIDEIAKEVIDGKWDNYPRRKELLEAAGYNYSEVQARVNEILAPKPTPAPTPQPTELKIGDAVKIIGTGNGSSFGTSNTAWGLNWNRQILNIWSGRPYPYQVGDGSGTTGFYKADALRKL